MQQLFWGYRIDIYFTNLIIFIILMFEFIYSYFLFITLYYNFTYMSNIFLQLSKFNFNREALESITGAAKNKIVFKAIDAFYQSGKNQLTDYSNILIDLLAITKEGAQKLLIALVYFIVNFDQKQAIKCLDGVLATNQPVILKVKFFSYVFKSTNNKNIQKWVIKSTVSVIENEQKVSSYANIIQHFDELIEKLDLSQNQFFQIYYKLTSYLERHIVYKKLCSVYVIKGLQHVSDQTAQTKQAKDLVVKAIKSGVISDSALGLLNHQALKKNQLYPILEVLLTGDYQKLNLDQIKKLEKEGLVGEEILRKMKIEAIPRLLSTVKVAGYDQVAEKLQIKKSEVESYIIDAIKEGIIKAKLDQFQQTVVINRINFRALRKEQRAKLQKDISQLVDLLSSNLVSLQ